MKNLFWFVDTRKEESKPFAIHNKDVAKTWKNEFASENGPFRPVDGPEELGDQTPTDDEETPETNENEGQTIDSSNPSLYDDMTNDELKAELDARGVGYKSKATKPELINLLVEDDKTGGE